jgi:hypothetical protein
MTPTNTFLAIFLGRKDSARRAAWDAMPESEQHAKGMAGVAAWNAWVEANLPNIVTLGGPLGKTKHVSAAGVEDVANNLTGFTVVKASSADEAAALFLNHPHFSIFPGDSVEIMPISTPPTF